MSIKPILFNTEMVQALLEGRKTVTRRVVKPQPKNTVDKMAMEKYHKPYCPGDILYVRETFTKYQTVNYIKCRDGRAFSEVSDGRYAYKADGYENIDDFKDTIRLLSDYSLEAVEVWEDKWHSPVHMPREAARIFLRVTDVRVERLQNITSRDIECEGIDLTDLEGLGCITRNEYTYAFQSLWNSTLKPKDRALYGWDANPWVFVISFERCDKPKEM